MRFVASLLLMAGLLAAAQYFIDIPCTYLVGMHFVLHEMDPEHHLKALASAKRVSKRILAFEPTLSGEEMFVRLWSIWRNAARVVGGFEEYRPPEYWLQLLKELSMNVIEVRIISWGDLRAPRDPRAHGGVVDRELEA